MEYNPAHFGPFTDKKLLRVKKSIRNKKDCVINAMEVLALLPEKEAELLRVMVDDVGMTKTQVFKTFMIIFPNFNWKYKRYTTFASVKQILDDLPPGHAVFAAYTPFIQNVKEPTHAFVLARDSKGVLGYIDPQVPAACNITKEECFQYLRGMAVYFILHAAPLEKMTM